VIFTVRRRPRQAELRARFVGSALVSTLFAAPLVEPLSLDAIQLLKESVKHRKEALFCVCALTDSLARRDSFPIEWFDKRKTRRKKENIDHKPET